MSGTPSQFQIDQVEAALLTLLTSGMPAAYGTALSLGAPQRVDVDSIGDKDFDDSGNLVLRPPALRVQFTTAEYDNLRDNQRLSYEAALAFEVLCFEESLRGKKDQRKQTLVLVDTAQDQLAGARLALADGTSSAPIEIKAVQLVVTDSGPVDQLFAISVIVRGIAQFSGANARFGQ